MKKDFKLSKKYLGFSLVELALTLTISGILISAVASGKALYDSSKLTNIIEQARSYTTSALAFKSKYNEWPGDSASMNSYYGTACADTANHCNGDGNGTIDQANQEPNKAWKHLSLTGMNSFNAAVLDGSGKTVIGVTAPRSKIDGAGYVIMSSESANASLFGSTGIAIMLAKEGGANETINQPSLTASQAFEIDRKIDDGANDSSGHPIGASTGSFRAYDRTTSGLCANTATGAYNISQSDLTCVVGVAVNSNLGPVVASTSGSGSGNSTLPTLSSCSPAPTDCSGPATCAQTTDGQNTYVGIGDDGNGSGNYLTWDQGTNTVSTWQYDGSGNPINQQTYTNSFCDPTYGGNCFSQDNNADIDGTRLIPFYCGAPA